MLQDKDLVTPACVISEEELLSALDRLNRLADEAGCTLLYTLKACSLLPAVELIAPRTGGFSASSLFEAVLARQTIQNKGTVHLTTPGLRSDEIEMLSHVCDYISFNSLNQWKRLGYKTSRKLECGLRVNPGISFVKDIRYDPCRPGSKLGVPMNELRSVDSIKGITGIHFHSNCDSRDLAQFLATVQHVDANLGHLLPQMKWINTGGGYLLDEARNPDAFYEAVRLLKTKYGLQVFIEPGSAVIRGAVRIISEVVDLFERDGQRVAVLDTTINHMPEIFEYGFRPSINEEAPEGEFDYVLAGSTCLSGDLFGDFIFAQPLTVGSRLTFMKMGSYTMAKATMFNGLNLPALYVRRADGKLDLIKRFGYADFVARIGEHVKLQRDALSFLSLWAK